MGEVIPFPRQRRRYRRTPIYQPVALVHDNATVATGMAVNLSVGGMQVLCDRYTADSLHRSDDPFAGGRGPGLDVHMRLPTRTGTARIDVTCQLVYVNQIATSTYLLGLEFRDYQCDSQALINDFLDEADQFTG